MSLKLKMKYVEEILQQAATIYSMVLLQFSWNGFSIFE